MELGQCFCIIQGNQAINAEVSTYIFSLPLDTPVVIV